MKKNFSNTHRESFHYFIQSLDRLFPDLYDRVLRYKEDDDYHIDITFRNEN